MVNTNSVGFAVGKRVGHGIMTYVGVRLVIKGTQIIAQLVCTKSFKQRFTSVLMGACTNLIGS